MNEHDSRSARCVTRRQLLGGIVGGCAAATLPWPARAAPARSRVVLIRDRDVVDGNGKLRAATLEQMLDQAVTRLLDAANATAAWRRLLRPQDTLGIKSNVWQFLPTPPELEQVLRKRARAAGVREERISVDDRGVLGNPVFQRSTALINIRPMRTHHWAGVGSLIKNYIMFVPHPARYHPDSCADLAAIWKLPHVAGRTRLNVLVMLTPLFHGLGAHHYDPRYVWRYGGLLVGTDPVAVDSVGLRIILAKRRAHFKEERRLQPSAKHIAIADERHHLGTADPKRIELIKLGWADGALV